MIGPSGAVRVMVATKPVGFRKGAEGLAGLVRETMRADPFSGSIYVFRAKRADRIKLIFWDGPGVCLFAKRLEDGEFRWLKIEDGVMRLSAAEFSALLEGLDWRRVHTGDFAGMNRDTVNQAVKNRREAMKNMVFFIHDDGYRDAPQRSERVEGDARRGARSQ